MTDNLIPENAHKAAARGFIRTTAHAYSTALAGGISANAILAVTNGSVELVPTLITWGVAAVSPILAGAASYFSLLSAGIPEDYAPAVIDR